MGGGDSGGDSGRRWPRLRCLRLSGYSVTVTPETEASTCLKGWACEMTTSQHSAREQGLARLRAGETALAEGRLERAVDALVEAESIFRQIDDQEHLADSRMGLAEAQRQHGAIDQAANSYSEAVTLYREANLPAREASPRERAFKPGVPSPQFATGARVEGLRRDMA